jgi:radical S-adenosyl methionine domain-containing protein 2
MRSLDAGMVKVNFSGGEPFLPDRGRYLGELVKYCKEELGLQKVSIVSNGSLIREEWFVKYGEYRQNYKNKQTTI